MAITPYMPHGHCYLWMPDLVALHVVSDGLIFASYMAIPAMLLYILKKRRDIPYNRVVLCFALFIVGCGATHLMEILTVWVPAYWAAGAVKALTAAASVGTAIVLYRLIPALMKYPGPDDVKATEETLEMAIAKVTELERQKIEAQFMANVSHDLRTPIAAIRGYSETLLKGGLDDEENRAEFVRIIRRNAERIGSLVENLLALTTVDAAQTRRLAVEIDLASFVSDVIADLAPAAKRRHVELLNEVGSGLSVKAQDQQLWQILQNLMGNAIKFTPRDGSVTVRARAAGDDIELSVADTGRGIDPAQLPLLFDRFHLRRQGKPIDKGSGLGLTIVRALVEAHGGTVSVESHPGVGSTFRFTLPRAPRSAASLPLA